MKFDRSSRHLVLMDVDGEAFVKDILKTKYKKGEAITRSIFGHGLLDVITSRNNRLILTSDLQNRIRVCDFFDTYGIGKYLIHKDPVVNMYLTLDDEYLLSLTTRGDLSLWRLQEENLVKCWNVYSYVRWKSDSKQERAEASFMKATEVFGKIFICLKIEGAQDLFLLTVNTSNKTLKYFGGIDVQDDVFDFSWVKDNLYYYCPDRLVVRKYSITSLGLIDDTSFSLTSLRSVRQDLKDFITFNATLNISSWKAVKAKENLVMTETSQISRKVSEDIVCVKSSPQSHEERILSITPNSEHSNVDACSVEKKTKKPIPDYNFSRTYVNEIYKAAITTEENSGSDSIESNDNSDVGEADWIELISLLKHSALLEEENRKKSELNLLRKSNKGPRYENSRISSIKGVGRNRNGNKSSNRGAYRAPFALGWRASGIQERGKLTGKKKTTVLKPVGNRTVRSTSIDSSLHPERAGVIASHNQVTVSKATQKQSSRHSSYLTVVPHLKVSQINAKKTSAKSKTGQGNTYAEKTEESENPQPGKATDKPHSDHNVNVLQKNMQGPSLNQDIKKLEHKSAKSQHSSFWRSSSSNYAQSSSPIRSKMGGRNSRWKLTAKHGIPEEIKQDIASMAKMNEFLQNNNDELLLTEKEPTPKNRTDSRVVRFLEEPIFEQWVSEGRRRSNPPSKNKMRKRQEVRQQTNIPYPENKRRSQWSQVRRTVNTTKFVLSRAKSNEDKQMKNQVKSLLRVQPGPTTSKDSPIDLSYAVLKRLIKSSRKDQESATIQANRNSLIPKGRERTKVKSGLSGSSAKIGSFKKRSLSDKSSHSNTVGTKPGQQTSKSEESTLRAPGTSQTIKNLETSRSNPKSSKNISEYDRFLSRIRKSLEEDKKPSPVKPFKQYHSPTLSPYIPKILKNSKISDKLGIKTSSHKKYTSTDLESTHPNPSRSSQPIEETRAH